MNTMDIKTALSKYIGKEVSLQEANIWKIANDIRDLFPDTMKSLISHTTDRSTITYIYRYGAKPYEFIRLFEVKVKKSKSETHRSFYGDHTDYFVKDFDINLFGYADLEAVYERVNQAVNRSAEKQDKSCEQIKTIMRTLNITFNDFRELCRYTEANWYELAEKTRTEVQP